MSYLTVADLFMIRDLAKGYLKDNPLMGKLEAIRQAETAVKFNKRVKIKLA